VKALYIANLGPAVATVTFNANLAEYRVRLTTAGVEHPAADYFTADADDARRTAWAMARHEHSQGRTT